MSILYITQNGVTDHIGRSQVAPYVMGLARQGFDIHVLSAEKDGREALVADYQRQFDACGVRWTRVRYRNKPPILGQALTQWAMKRAARNIIKREGVRVVHCRSFPPALIAHALKRKLGVRYIFDFRDFYADGGLEKSRGLARLVFKRLKRLEGPLIRDADKVVCLTERARDVLTQWYLSDVPNAAARFQVIPCCADFAHFDPSRVTAEDVRRARVDAGLSEGDRVMLYLGSLGPDYLLSHMMAAFRQYLDRVPAAKFLFVSNNGSELVADQARRQGVPADRIAFVSVDRDQLPAYVLSAEISVMFIRADISKAGCSPTKLAELFACGVPVIANAGVGDLDRIIDLDRNGSVVVSDFGENTLRAAVEAILERRRLGLPDIRANSTDFMLEEGVSRYAAVYTELLGPQFKETTC